MRLERRVQRRSRRRVDKGRGGEEGKHANGNELLEYVHT